MDETTRQRLEEQHQRLYYGVLGWLTAIEDTVQERYGDGYTADGLRDLRDIHDALRRLAQGWNIE